LQSAAHKYFQNPQISFRASNKTLAHVPLHNDQNPPQKVKLKPSDFTQENTRKPGLKHLQDMSSTPNKNRHGLKVSSQETGKISAPYIDLQEVVQ
jgi:hypothetical protein